MGDNGDPKDWPAAQPKPPSLAGAYSDNMIKVIVHSCHYQDWVYAHPNPALVKNLRWRLVTSTYSQELAFVEHLAHKWMALERSAIGDRLGGSDPATQAGD